MPGDGREYVLTEMSALKTNAEDGRLVGNVNLAFFSLARRRFRVESFLYQTCNRKRISGGKYCGIYMWRSKTVID